MAKKTGSKGKPNKSDLTDAVGILLANVGKVLIGTGKSSESLKQKAFLEAAPAVIKALMNPTKKDIAFMSNAVRIATLYKVDEDGLLAQMNGAHQRYLLTIAPKNKKLRKLIEGNM